MKRTLGTVLLLAGCSLASRGQAGIFSWNRSAPPPVTSFPSQPALPVTGMAPAKAASGMAPVKAASGEVLIPVPAEGPAVSPAGEVPPPMVSEEVIQAPDKAPPEIAPSGVYAAKGPAEIGTAGLYHVNSKFFRLAYDFKDVGPSGMAGVEVWYTRNGQTWQPLPGIQRDNPCLIEVAEEGTYGIILVGKTGFGGGKKPPSTGDKPQLWVEVDQTKPQVFLTGTNLGAGTHALTVTWTATDKNLSPRPVGIYYAEQSAGPWMPIATNVENNGRFVWQIPPSTPNSFLVRIQASDLAGNVGTAVTPTPVQIDLAEPSVTNIRLTALNKDK